METNTESVVDAVPVVKVPRKRSPRKKAETTAEVTLPDVERITFRLDGKELYAKALAGKLQVIVGVGESSNAKADTVLRFVLVPPTLPPNFIKAIAAFAVARPASRFSRSGYPSPDLFDSAGLQDTAKNDEPEVTERPRVPGAYVEPGYAPWSPGIGGHHAKAALAESGTKAVRTNGTVEKLETGFGYIRSANGESVFFGSHDLQDCRIKNLIVGDRVVYTPGTNGSGACARRVVLIGA